jgi:2-succinyl-6-hydroxy-2,4-cyclohexadiene-1-carboxylate synthase
VGSAVPIGLIYALHGFLGQGRDWDNIKSKLETEKINFTAEDLFSKSAPEILDLDQHAELLINKIQKSQLKSKIFIGYSLGGRLGLHMLKQAPDLFDKWIFLSVNSGLSSLATEERRLRILNDKMWGQKITEKNWSSFLMEWNAQSVFAGSLKESARDASDYDLFKLQQSLQKWSLGLQADFSEVIKKNQSKIVWVVGDRDTKYVQHAEDLKNKEIILEYKKISAGHRIYLDNPADLAQIIESI